jgi:hypothetical protein
MYDQSRHPGHAYLLRGYTRLLEGMLVPIEIEGANPARGCHSRVMEAGVRFAYRNHVYRVIHYARSFTAKIPRHERADGNQHVDAVAYPTGGGP